MKFRRFHLGMAAVGLVLVLSTSAATPTYRAESGYRVGDVIPEMKQSVEPVPRMRPSEGAGHYTLVHFWAAYDAQSRATNVVLDRFFSRTVSDKISYQAISLDPDSDVYKSTIGLDGLDPLHQYCAGSQREAMMQQYRLQSSMHSYLVDERGVVVSVDPSIEELEQFYLL